MSSIKYSTGETVQIGDIVDIGHGSGPQMQVVVVIPSGEAAIGFNASEWAYLKNGVILQDTKMFGLLHISELSQEEFFVSRGPNIAFNPDAP